jgi:hypothetical protein
MDTRKTETLTLHFDLSHCPPEEEFSLSALGKRYVLTRHTPDTFGRFTQENRALALIPPEHQHKVTHFAEGVELPADAVGMHLVTYPSPRGDGGVPELALPFIHIPTDAKRSHFRRRRKSAAARPLPSSLANFGVESIPPEEEAAVCLDATLVQTPFQAAEAIIFNHPDLLTLRQDVAATVIYDHIGLALTKDDTLPHYISANGPDKPTPWYTVTVAKNPQTGEPITPITEDENGNPIRDKDGNPITWHQQNGQNVIQQYSLSPGVIGDGTPESAAAFSALAAVLRSTKDDLSLNGQSWSVQHGIMATQHKAAAPASPEALFMGRPRAAEDDSGFKWNLSNKTSTYGLETSATQTCKAQISPMRNSTGRIWITPPWRSTWPPQPRPHAGVSSCSTSAPRTAST